LSDAYTIDFPFLRIMNGQDVMITSELGVSFHPKSLKVTGQSNFLVDSAGYTQPKAWQNGAKLGFSSLSYLQLDMRP
jgi:hypothetical protein